MQAEPKWEEMYEWARNMARKMIPNKYWVDELASAAVSHYYTVWQQYRQLPDSEFQKVTSTILYYAMLADIKEDKTKGTHACEVKEVQVEVTCAPKCHVTAEVEFAQKSTDGGVPVIENKIDREIVMATVPKVCTPIEVKVMDAGAAAEDASADQIASLVNKTPGAVRFYKCNAVKKLKLFFYNDINVIGGKSL